MMRQSEGAYKADRALMGEVLMLCNPHCDRKSITAIHEFSHRATSGLLGGSALRAKILPSTTNGRKTDKRYTPTVQPP
jgi:hypothetical protein